MSISAEGLHIVQIVNHLVLSGTVCLAGIVVNVVNMIVFYQQGLSTNINISLFAISLSDLCSLITLEWLNINLNPFMERADLPYEPNEIQYLTGGWPHACFARITVWITIYITAERFCCIAFPLQVKKIITRSRTKIFIIVIYLVMFISLAPEYITMYFGWKFNSARNQTRVGLVDRPGTEDMKSWVFLLYGIIGIISFLLLVIFTCLLVVYLKRRSENRSKSTCNEERSNAISNRDRKTMKMVILIAIILIMCFTPAFMLCITVFTVPEFNLMGIYANIFHTTFSISFLAEAINSSVNIILFYKMSSSYRTCKKLFVLSRCRKCQSPGSKTETETFSTVLEIPRLSSDINVYDCVSSKI